MKKIALLAITTLVVASCHYISNYDKPYLELTDQQLKITDFNWGYGVTGFNQFNGDFDRLDEKVYNLLKGKSGSCEVYLQDTDKDKYGNVSDHMEDIGRIDIDELNKFQDWTYWQKEHGLRTLLYKKFVQRESSTQVSDASSATLGAAMDSKAENSQIQSSQVSDSKTELFSIDQLYPTGERPPLSETDRFVITGTIGNNDFDKGTFQVITIDGDKVALMFDPDRMDLSERQRLASVLVQGNSIKCVGTNVEPGIYELLAAKVILK